MANRKLQIPVGMQDTLPGECTRRRALEGDLRKLLRLSGYQEIATPILEYYDAFDDATYGYRPEHVWKTFDSAGRVLAIRPDTTIPAVRIAAGKMKDAPLPLRLCYVQSATAYQSDTLSMLCEMPQCGVELMGESSPLADAEVIALAVESLKEAGLRNFQLELGHAAFFRGFMQEAGLTEDEIAVMRSLTGQKNPIAMQMYLKKLSVKEEVTQRLMRLPLLYGDASVLDEAVQLTNHPLCLQAIDNLRAILAALEDYGCADVVSIDLGMVQQFDYYSGTIFRGLTASLGQPLLSGGRYDGLPARYGRSMPAVGFAISLKLLLMALEQQGEAFVAPIPDELVAFEDGHLKDALRYCRMRRAAGASVVMLYDVTEEEVRARAGGNETAVFIGKNGISCLPGKGMA